MGYDTSRLRQYWRNLAEVLKSAQNQLGITYSADDFMLIRKRCFLAGCYGHTGERRKMTFSSITSISDDDRPSSESISTVCSPISGAATGRQLQSTSSILFLHQGHDRRRS